MKKYAFTFFLILIFLIVVFFIIHFVSTDKKNNLSPSVVTTENVSLPSFDGKGIYIYSLSRETFVDFISKVDTVSSLNVERTTQITNATQVYLRDNATKFTFNNEIYSFLNDENAIKNFICDIAIEIQYLVVLDIPNTPVTAVVISDKATYFITLKEDINNKDRLFTLYTKEEYEQKFSVKDGSLIINNKQIKTTILPQVYGTYAEVPLIETLENLGAEIENKSKNEYKIKLNNEIYYLDVEDNNLYSKNDKKTNLLYLTAGGRCYIYAKENDLMIDSATLNCILSDMGIEMHVNIDWENSQVILKDK